MALSGSLFRLSKETLPSVLFAQPPVVRFAPERDTCHCGETLRVQKTRRKKVLSMIGPFVACETVAKCPLCANIFYSGSLLRLVGRRCNVAYDVLVFVGQALFQRHRNSQEVRSELIARNVRLSISEIEYLGRKFITYLALGHKQAMPRIRQEMILAGGYVLHLDATHEGEAPALMTGIDSLSNIVLANVKIPSEHADHIIPFLRKLKTNYGTPQACVHDMGTGILKAVLEVFPGTRDFICHFHFLRDIGKDLLGPAYGELRKQLRSHAISSRILALVRDVRQSLAEQNFRSEMLAKSIKNAAPTEDIKFMSISVTYSLSLWALHGKHSGDGYGFPFDRPLLDFAERLLELDRRLPELLDILMTGEESLDKNPMVKLAAEVRLIAYDSALCRTVKELRWRSQIFDRLRQAMRIAPVNGRNGLNDEGTPGGIATIRDGVEKFRQEIENDPKLRGDALIHKMAKQIDKYRDKLFADPIKVDTPKGPITIYPQRTNNILERFFRGERHAHRRKTGNDSMNRVLQAMLADAPLVRNLDNPNYMKILLDGKADLEALFAELGEARFTRDNEPQFITDRILPGFRTLMNMPTLPDHIIQLTKKQVNMSKSN